MPNGANPSRIMTDASEIIDFWRDAGPKAWFAKDDDFDAIVRAMFEETHHAAARGDLKAWEETHEGALALLLLLDQFPRNMYRGSAHAFATDGLARQIATRAVDRGFDRMAPTDMRAFFYLPFEHSERAEDQARSCALFVTAEDENNIKWARLHAEIIGKYGRFPHRNEALGRESTPEELAFLESGGFKG